MYEQLLKLCKGREVQVLKPLTVSTSHTFAGELYTDHDVLHPGDWWIHDKGIVVRFLAEDIEKVTIEPKSTCSETDEMWVCIVLKYKRE